MINLYNQDCMEAMAGFDDNQFDLAIVDPPFGISDRMQGTNPMGQLIKNKNWNDNIPDKKYFDELRRVSKNQIIFGANYYANYLPNVRDWLVWDKKKGDNNYAMHELCWTSFNRVPKIIRVSAEYRDRFHPCQKPIKLYEEILVRYAEQGDKILDTFLGSGTIAIACHNFGYDLEGYELDKEYYIAAKKRLEEHQSQLRMF